MLGGELEGENSICFESTYEEFINYVDKSL